MLRVWEGKKKKVDPVQQESREKQPNNSKQKGKSKKGEEKKRSRRSRCHLLKINR